MGVDPAKILHCLSLFILSIFVVEVSHAPCVISLELLLVALGNAKTGCFSFEVFHPQV
jgi:hypothetical protein